MQQFKTVYFSDAPEGRSLTMAFGDQDATLFDGIRGMTSLEVRELLGSHSIVDLSGAASSQGTTLNAYCLRLLRLGADRMSATDRSDATFGAIEATYRGGVSEPMHSWYPLLEAFSPAFVQQVLARFAPSATRVLDPFAGTGTTPITAALLGKSAVFAEVNPVLQLLTDTKLRTLELSPVAKARLADHCEAAAGSLTKSIECSPPNKHLRTTFDIVFGQSVFFDAAIFEQVLRLRSVIDEVSCRDQLLASILTIATIAGLVPASRLVRRGDLRFRTPDELERHHPDLVSATAEKLLAIAADLRRLPTIGEGPKLIAEDARLLHRLPPLDIDAVVTSPPYLNGTNYFRNTKIELWFTRSLNSPADLAAYRQRAVTSGINDVAGARGRTRGLPLTAGLVEALTASAYDRRIPAMVAGFFEDMHTIFAGLRPHLKPRATVAIDLGDSCYGRVHVKTDGILTDLMSDLGYVAIDEIVLRRRMSRSGEKLRQVLLVFAAPRPLPAHQPIRSWTPPQEWLKFKESLPHQAQPYVRRNWGHPLHSLCSYEGKMKPSLAHFLARTFVPPGGRVLDPFAGVGTIPFEAAQLGAKSFSFDLSPAAVHVARAKVSAWDRSMCDRELAHLERYLETEAVSDEDYQSADAIRFNKELKDYFHPQTFREVLLARRYFLQLRDWRSEHELIFASLLHILHGNRPYALSRRSHPITPFAPTGPSEYRSLMPRLKAKVDRSFAVERSIDFTEGEVLKQDATSWWPRHIDQLDAIITSPPFFASTRFYLSNWMRLWFAGWEATDFRTQPLSFVDERQRSDFRVYEPIFRQARERLKGDGVVVLHLGRSPKSDMVARLTEVARPWFRTLDTFIEDVRHVERHGIRDKGSVVDHGYLVLGNA